VGGFVAAAAVVWSRLVKKPSGERLTETRASRDG